LLKLDVHVADFILTPFPLAPFPVNTKSSFNRNLKKKKNQFEFPKQSILSKLVSSQSSTREC
jgi:hypothetical protein